MFSNSLMWRYASNDLRKNRGVNVALLLVLVLSAFLMATGVMVMERMFGAVDTLFDQARPPHFLQMHKGDYDGDALARFAQQHDEIDAWLIQDTLGYDSAAISWQRPSTAESGDLSESLTDNLFVTQNEQFDYLIDESGQVPEPKAGDVYVPVAYRQRFKLESGDRLGIRTSADIHELEVVGFVRDSQMASSLSSATRFVVSPSDFKALTDKGGGAPEIIAEYRLINSSDASTFMTAYESEQALPKNGPAITYAQIRLVNAFSDGLVAVALIFVSMLLIAISILNLRFVIRGTLEDDVREIGVMKAIGIPSRTIRRIYLSKFAVLTLISCVIGGLLAIPGTSYLVRDVQENYAASPFSVMTVLSPLVALFLLFVFVIAMCWVVLRAVRRIEVVNALVHGSTLGERQIRRLARRQAKQARRRNLADYGGSSIDRRLVAIDLLAERRQWLLIPLVFFLVAVLMVLPTNLLSTFQSPRFVTYMGSPETDLRADIQFSEDVDSVRNDVVAAMERDDRLKDIRVYANVLEEVQGEEGWEAFRVEVGDYSSGSVEFLDGARPAKDEIALSIMNSREYGASVGDTIALRRDGVITERRVSGIYQDVTSGGLTAKVQGDVEDGAVAYVLYANIVEGSPRSIASEYNAHYPDANVIPMQEYVGQTLSYITGAFRTAAIIAAVFGLGVAFLITVLFLRLRVAKDRRRIGILSAMGFSGDDIVRQIELKVLITTGLGVGLGVLFAATVGQSMVSGALALSGFGVARLHFITSPFIVYMLYPAMLVLVGYVGTMIMSRQIRSADKSQWIRQ